MIDKYNIRKVTGDGIGQIIEAAQAVGLEVEITLRLDGADKDDIAPVPGGVSWAHWKEVEAENILREAQEREEDARKEQERAAENQAVATTEG